MKRRLDVIKFFKRNRLCVEMNSWSDNYDLMMFIWANDKKKNELMINDVRCDVKTPRMVKTS